MVLCFWHTKIIPPMFMYSWVNMPFRLKKIPTLTHNFHIFKIFFRYKNTSIQRTSQVKPSWSNQGLWFGVIQMPLDVPTHKGEFNYCSLCLKKSYTTRKCRFLNSCHMPGVSIAYQSNMTVTLWWSGAAS